MFYVLIVLFGCTEEAKTSVDNCATQDAFASCLKPVMSAEYYIEQSSAYFDTMDYTVELDGWPPYSELVARWEWPPWLKLTAFTRDNIESTDTLLQLYPSIVTDRVCQAFDTHPFGRCFVMFYYDAHDGLGCTKRWLLD